jgi:hypothetical protein
MFEISSEELGQLTAQYGDMGEEHRFYNGTVTLRFARKNWVWSLLKEDGSWEPQNGVTSITKRAVDKSEALIGWAKKRVLEKLKRLILDQYIAPDGLIQLFEDELDQVIRESKRANEEELDAAGETGHQAHDWVEKWIKACLGHGDKDYLLDHMPADDRAKSCCNAALYWMAAHDVKWISTERKVYSRRYKFAGTLDGLARVSSCSDPLCCKSEFNDRLSIIDWKTSNALYLEYLLQTAAYQQAIEEEDGIEIEDRWIIRLGKEDAEFDPWHAEGREVFLQDFQAYLTALRMTQAVDVVEDRLANLKGVRKALKLEQERKKKEEALKIKCKSADKYKGIRKPTCNGGNPCQTCVAKYKEKHEA